MSGPSPAIPSHSRIRTTTMDLKKSVRCQEDVALTITKHLLLKQDFQQKNLVFSPLSLFVVLSVVAAGSEGHSLDQLLSFLQFDSIDNLIAFFSQLVALFSDDRMCFINGMWADESIPLSHSFKQLVATHYNTTLASVDFKTKGGQACRDVNLWVEKETNGLITKLLHPSMVSNSTELVFANALCFNGVWEHMFMPISVPAGFHLLNGTKVIAPFMLSKQREHFIGIFDGFKVLRLSYKQGRDETLRFSMYIFLPNAKDGLLALIEKLASESDFLKDKFPQRKVEVRRFTIPKFKISFSFEASNVLHELGMISPFVLTKVVEGMNPPLGVESIYHNAFIEVNEKGTIASANTIMRAARGKRCATPTDFVADHPFLFLIREDFSGTILFIGQVLNPLDGANEPTISK
ncbi:serpin-ZX-like [Trifolium pratense]|uniref:Uncharacterized protein n=8 Tax=Trifolium pratense TaxID=57577 RepID=A0ACB0JZN3_TRIPR|nr:serpin-ZX-like [Trifolium pratense]XP_045807084.1 serpin-ZX-like [Trifolium pratense]XP_045807107.1 serpin-ZX-like [Trifolium pratense]CAJ2631017.1 unnamed protein product [Trifolium pratense]CAJ2649010.1 unnamed protein product [Trifolium pratense]CAJ2649015.1 unnamed protein product [Trifolium pratense]CAJ2661511.1 unnamed protein product [Trifolium pratense]